MKQSTAEITVEYVKRRPYIKRCLSEDLVNFSSLARKIARDLDIEKKSSKDAILVALRRFQVSLVEKKVEEKKVLDLLKESEISVKNKVVRFVLRKRVDFAEIVEFEKRVKSEFGLFFLFEGSDNYTIISQETYYEEIVDKFAKDLIFESRELALFMIHSSEEIEELKGVIAYLTSLFEDYDVNMLEILSFWRDTFVVVNKDDVSKVLDFLGF